MRLDLYTLQLFVAVIDQGGIAAAADQQHIAASALSKRITDMERCMGVTLLTRKARGVEPTMAGLCVAKKARLLLRRADEISQEIREFASGRAGNVRVGVNASALMQFLPTDLREFQLQEPAIQIEVQEQISSSVIRAVAENAVDIGICVAENSAAYDLHLFPYHRDSLTLVVPGGHPLAGENAIHFERTLNYHYVGMHKGSSLNNLLIAEASKLKAQIHIRQYVTSFDAVVAMVKANIGIGVIPTGIAHKLYVSDGIRLVTLADAWAVRELMLCIRREDELSSSALRLFEHLRASIQEEVAYH
ncbi:MAG: LysR family transcriptional regulator [Alcaligenaceae bacterium]|nr:LysR family transcriptional regulator [Alcaligenaceae bacterium SAGV5]MPS53204.1 LysR family transcriptional regulator [Alcaligenaceae bacterium SAGV3]MPT55358.1 LysR family transcriptional regulator [Alcaligenaceae bacterium]